MPPSDSQSATFSIGQETVHLRARKGRAGVLLERESYSLSGRRGDVRVTQVLLANERNLRGFLRAEPYYGYVAPAVTLLVSNAQEPLGMSTDRQEQDTLDAIRLLARAPDETALIAEMMKIVRALEADTAFFLLAEQALDGHQESFRILAGSNTEVTQTYVARKWYATDPFLMHASKSHLPFFSSDVAFLANLSGSWREMGEFAGQLGLRNWIVMPAHYPGVHGFGALYAANGRLPADNGEGTLRHNRLLFKLLAAELFDWYANQEKALALKSSGLVSQRKVGYVIHSPRWGTLLRQEYGVPFWSKVNPEGIDAAQVFADAKSAQRVLRTLQMSHDCELRRVDVHYTCDAASIDDCIAAGIPPWDPSSPSSGAPADNSSTAGTLDGPPAQYH